MYIANDNLSPLPSHVRNLTIHNLHPEPVASHIMARREEEGASWDEFEGAWFDDEADEACHICNSDFPLTDAMKATMDEAFFRDHQNTLEAIGFA